MDQHRRREPRKPWEKAFIVVQWDQRGAGHTFGRYGTKTPDVTLDRISKDGVELAEHLCRELGKKKIIVLGHSWGSLVATRMIQIRPDLFAAYVGTGQAASWMALVNTQYDLLLAKARKDGNQATAKELEAIGAPARPMATTGVSSTNTIFARCGLPLIRSGCNICAAKRQN